MVGKIFPEKSLTEITCKEVKVIAIKNVFENWTNWRHIETPCKESEFLIGKASFWEEGRQRADRCPGRSHSPSKQWELSWVTPLTMNSLDCTTSLWWLPNAASELQNQHENICKAPGAPCRKNLGDRSYTAIHIRLSVVIKQGGTCWAGCSAMTSSFSELIDISCIWRGCHRAHITSLMASSRSCFLKL